MEHFIEPAGGAIIYLAKESAIWGVVEITEVLLKQTLSIGWLKKGWEARKGAQISGAIPARVRFRPVCSMKPPRQSNGPDNPARNQLECITDKKRWNVFVQIALSRVPGTDVHTVERWTREAAT